LDLEEIRRRLRAALPRLRVAFHVDRLEFKAAFEGACFVEAVEV